MNRRKNEPSDVHLENTSSSSSAHQPRAEKRGSRVKRPAPTGRDTEEFPGEETPPRHDPHREITDEDNLVRINHLLQLAGVCSRRSADRLISEGRVKVDGRVISQLGTKVHPDAKLSVNGIAVGKKPSKTILLLNKPDLYLTSRVSEGDLTSIFELKSLKKLPRNVQSVGRLDFRTEGLLVLTNDGILAQALAHPSNGITKTYCALLNAEVLAEDLAKLRKGIMLADGFAKPLQIKKLNRSFLGSAKRGQWIEITVNEGRNRLIRRLFETLDYRVVRLIRTAVGEVLLSEELKAGEVMAPTPQQLEFFKQIKAKYQSIKPTK